MPSARAQLIIANTVVAFTVTPFSPWSIGFVAKPWDSFGQGCPAQPVALA
jgi:hypothetical protein